jgi:hypothetical protein
VRQLFIVGLLAIAALAPARATAEPEVSVTLEASPSEVRVGELIRLEVRVRARGGSIDGLQLADLRKYPELEIVSHQTVRPMQFSFGFGSGVQVESSLAHVYMLRPRAPGEYPFDPATATVDGEPYRSQPLAIIVRQGAQMPNAPSSPEPAADAGTPDLSGSRFDERAFLRTVVEPTEAYVGQQVDVTVYLYTRLRLGPQSVVPTKPDMDGFWVYDDPITSLQAQTVSVMGTRYQAYALHRSVAFPQRTGELTIGAPKVTFDVATMSFFDAPERIERVGVPVTVKVAPLPSGGPPGAVVGRYELTASLDRSEVNTGDAVTLRVEASGVGNVQDLRVDLPPIVGVRALQPTIRDQQSFVGRELSGTRTFEWILIAETPGEHRIPSIELHYFDPKTEEYGTAATAEVFFTALGAPKPAGATLEPQRPRPETPARTFGPIGMYSALRRGETPVRSQRWFVWALAAPPIGFAFFVLMVAVYRRREQRSTTAGAVQRKLLRSASAALSEDDPRAFYDRVVAAMHHALDVRLGEQVAGLPHAQLRERLASAGFDDDLTKRVVNELEGADFARFAASGVDREEMHRCLQRVTTLVQRIERGSRVS